MAADQGEQPARGRRGAAARVVRPARVAQTQSDALVTRRRRRCTCDDLGKRLVAPLVVSWAFGHPMGGVCPRCVPRTVPATVALAIREPG